MNAQEVRKMTDEEISLEIRSLRSKIHTMRTQVVTDKVEDVSSFEKTRRDVARLLTERNARFKNGGGAGKATAAAKSEDAKPAKKASVKKAAAKPAAKKAAAKKSVAK